MKKTPKAPLFKSADRKALQQIVRLVRRNRDFVLTTHETPDGDGLGAQSALYVALKKMGKRVRVVNHDALPEKFDYLAFKGAYQKSDRIPPHQVCFVMDAGSFTRIREGVSRSEFGILVNLDHHYSNNLYGDYNLVLPEASATGEVVYHLIKALGVKVDRAIAESVYTSLVTDTGGFRYRNTTPKVLRLAAELVEAGAEAQKVCDRIFAGVTPEAMDLTRISLGHTRFFDRGAIGTMTLTQADLKKSGATDDDTENLINFVRKINTVKIAVFLKQRLDGRLKLSLRSRSPKVNVARIAKRFGGGGHSYAAGALLPGPLSRALPRVVAVCRRFLK
ncbi:MAG TPA: bifunctional oligoribonuclease/PAP phosphatase NrnA [bacterium]|nr:bifunctional oligoribonuclease/PAP phosphatase NrnA [bacterium]